MGVFPSVEPVAWSRLPTPDETCGLASSWLFSPRRQAHFLLELHIAIVLMPNVRAKGAPAVGRQGPVGENVPRTADRALVACRWRSL